MKDSNKNLLNIIHTTYVYNSQSFKFIERQIPTAVSDCTETSSIYCINAADLCKHSQHNTVKTRFTLITMLGFVQIFKT